MMAACNEIPAPPTSDLTKTQLPAITKTIEPVKEVINTPTKIVSPTETPTQVITPTTLPAFVKPPTPVPPSENWLVYNHTDTGLSFDYPANWFIYVESGYIYITNFRLDGMPLKGHDDERVKIDISITPIDLSTFPSITAYLEMPEQQPSTDSSGKIISQLKLLHEINGYEVIRQTHTGYMGNPEATYEITYVAFGGKAIRMVYREQYLSVADRIAGTMVIP